METGGVSLPSHTVLHLAPPSHTCHVAWVNVPSLLSLGTFQAPKCADPTATMPCPTLPNRSLACPAALSRTSPHLAVPCLPCPTGPNLAKPRLPRQAMPDHTQPSPTLPALPHRTSPRQAPPRRLEGSQKIILDATRTWGYGSGCQRNSAGRSGLPSWRTSPKLNGRSIDQEKVMLQGTSKRWHLMSLLCAVTIPSSGRFGGYADEQENAPAGKG